MHVKQTQGHVQRLEQVLSKMGEKTSGKKCMGMQGLLSEASELMGERADPDVMDAGLIVDCQKVEHYEIAGYGSAVTFCKLLGDQESARLLAQTLDEEKMADEKLTEIAENSINLEAEDESSTPMRSSLRSSSRGVKRGKSRSKSASRSKSRRR
jgi:ferritin-like metal-binding protein YciE